MEQEYAALSRGARLKIALGLMRDPTGRPSFIWLERQNSLIVAVMIAVGVPLLGWSDLGDRKIVIAAIWFAVWHPLYVYFEGREIIGQMQGRGSLDGEQAAQQMSTSQNPYWGSIFAFVVWLVPFAVHVTRRLPSMSDTMQYLSDVYSSVYVAFEATPIRYGWIEWSILCHMVLCTRLNNRTFYNIIMEFSKATPRAERAERRIPR